MTKPRFKPPKISAARYYQLTGPEFDVVCQKVSRENREWVKKVMTDPHASWCIVAGNKPIEFGYFDKAMPSVSEVRDRAESGKRAYLIKRPVSNYLDLTLYFNSINSKDVCSTIKIDENEEASHFLEEIEGVSKINIQSGALHKLEDAFALGKMIFFAPKIDGVVHKQGAFSARVTNKLYERKFLAIASQSKEEVLKRGSKTIDEYEPDKWLRIERLHKFDDAILDILSTYNTKKQGDWPELILYKPRE